MAEAKTKAQQLKAMDIKLIKMGQAALGLDDDTYRALLSRFSGGKTSSTALTWQERQEVIKYMKAQGFVVKRTAVSGRAWDDGMVKLRAIWYALASVRAVKSPTDSKALDDAIEAWARRMQPSITSLRFASGYQMQRLIEAAKKWAVRVGAPTEAEQIPAKLDV